MTKSATVELRQALLRGDDPLGESFLRSHSREDRRQTGSVYTPHLLVQRMLDLLPKSFVPETVIDCGCGSGRFAIECALKFEKAHIIAIDSSEEACRVCHQNVDALGLQHRVQVVQADFTTFDFGERRGRTLWVGNPPYIRHHNLSKEAKELFKNVCDNLGVCSSALAGLHIHFLATIAEHWQRGDMGCLVTSSEWLDTKYGETARSLLANYLGLYEMHLLDRAKHVFPDADTTAVIFLFGRHAPEVLCASGEGSFEIPRESLRLSSRWTRLFRENSPNLEEDLVPLGTYASVHRGVVTGDNRFWVRSAGSLSEVPQALSVPIVSHAREVTEGRIGADSVDDLKRLIVLPSDLKALNTEEAEAAKKIIRDGVESGVHNGYVASHRKSWWAIQPPEPPAVLMTYMSRKAPTFAVNESRLPMLNVVHGVYPKVKMSKKAIRRLVDYLNTSVSLDSGRMYCGGLVKFEPKEAEALMVPPLARLEE